MSTTRNEIVMLALSLIKRKSYSSFSYDDISRELNITKAAIHYHFRNKEDLGVAVCEAFRDAISMRCEERVKEAANGRHPWNILADMVTSQAQTGICPIVSMQSDYENLPERIRGALADLVTYELETVRTLVKTYDPDADIEAAILQFLALKGAMQYSRVLGEKFHEKTLKNIKKQFYRIIPKHD